MSETIRIFVGTDESQLGAAEVLKQSILETSADKNVDVHFMHKLDIPQPKDIRQSQRTGFSFARWAIPELCAYKGRAIYLDADMFVFRDIKELWNIPMNGEVVNFVDGRDTSFCSDKAKGNKNETSVMLLDCEKAKWSLAGLVDGLDGKYNYQDMMSHLCFLNETEISRTVPRYWNSMDYWNNEVGLIHFTNVPTQPWVSNENPVGHVWVTHLKRMIVQGKISKAYINAQVEKGYFRPSLLNELQGQINMGDAAYTKELNDIDKKTKFIPHRDVFAFMRRRERAIAMYDIREALKKDFKEFVRLAAKLAVNDVKSTIKKVIGRS